MFWCWFTYSASGTVFRIERVLIAVAAAVAVELNVSDVAAMSFECFERLERRGPVAGHAEVVAVDMDRVRAVCSCIDGLSHFANDLTRRHVEGIDQLVDAVHIAGRVLFPDFDTAGIHQLDGVSFGCPQQPGDERLHPLRVAVANRLHDVVVVAHQDVEPLVDTRRILEFFMGMACRERRDGGIKGGCVSESGVLVAGRKRAGHAPHRAAVRLGGAHDRFGQSPVFRTHLARHVHLGTGDVAVHVDPARHDHQAGRVQVASRIVRPGRSVAQRSCRPGSRCPAPGRRCHGPGRRRSRRRS